ncbi:hypothetical protein [Bacillus sp. X1(2014)]|uniref:hypothetical protein n=1 Tax=Bacillus sp. X1(2014) TaxID=1565991 RepID=UPI0011AA181F|nr:hypothetical protein [Bacillus sp. X1(2014)]
MTLYGVKNGRFFGVSYTNTDGKTVSTFGVQPYFFITPTYSVLRGGVLAEGLMFFGGLDPAPLNLDYVKAGTVVKVTDSDGKTYDAKLGSSTFPYYFTSNVPITGKLFTLQIDVPGHFTFKKSTTLGLDMDGQLVAGSKPIDYNYLPGGV